MWLRFRGSGGEEKRKKESQCRKGRNESPYLWSGCPREENEARKRGTCLISRVEKTIVFQTQGDFWGGRVERKRDARPSGGLLWGGDKRQGQNTTRDSERRESQPKQREIRKAVGRTQTMITAAQKKEGKGGRAAAERCLATFGIQTTLIVGKSVQGGGTTIGTCCPTTLFGSRDHSPFPRRSKKRIVQGSKTQEDIE